MKTLFLTCLVLIGTSLFAQAPNWDWAKRSGVPGIEQGISIDKDSEGNIYVAGVYNGSSISFGEDTLTNTYGYAMYLVKYDSSGNVQWAKGVDSVANTLASYIIDITIDLLGNIYVTGNYISPSLLKYDSLGNVLWFRDNEGSSESIVTDTSGNVYLAGIFNTSSMTIGSYIFNNTNSNPNAGLSSDLYLVKYDEMGNLLWAKSEGSSGYEDFPLITIDYNGNIILSGRFGYTETITFGNYTLTNSDSNSINYGYDIFIVKYDNFGNILWAKGAGASGYNSAERINGLSTDSQGNIYALGEFNAPTISFDNFTLLNVDSFASGSSLDAFMVKFDFQGTLIWVKGIGDSGLERGDDIKIDAYDNVYITGIYSNTITFGETILPNINFGATKIFVAKYDLNGNVLWANSSSGSSYSWAGEVAADNIGNVYVTGYYFIFPIIFGFDTLYSDTGTDMFIAKLNPNNITVTTEKIIEGIDYFIYPNPSNGIFYIKTENNISGIEIYNLMGELVCVNKNSNQIDLQTYSRGLYLARINGSNKYYRLINE